MQYEDGWLAQPGFTWRKGYALASACKLAYASTDEVARILSQVWRVRATVFSHGETQGFVAEGARAVTVAFRGTKGLADWFSNLDIAAIHADAFHGRVHRGFLDAFGDAAGTVANALAGTDAKALWFTGHSLGGAVALAGAATHLGLTPAGLVTFGQPRMLKTDAAQFIAGALGSRYIRVVNDTDIVAKVPPGFAHSGGLLHFGFDGELLPGSGAESVGDGADQGPPPLSDAEFEALQDAARRARASAPVVPPGAEGADTLGADVAIEGIIPGVEPHRIDNYVNLLRRKAGIGAPRRKAWASKSPTSSHPKAVRPVSPS